MLVLREKPLEKSVGWSGCPLRCRYGVLILSNTASLVLNDLFGILI